MYNFSSFIDKKLVSFLPSHTKVDDYEKRLGLYVFSLSVNIALICIVCASISLYNNYLHASTAYISLLILWCIILFLYIKELVAFKSALSVVVIGTFCAYFYILINTGGAIILLLWFVIIPIGAIIGDGKKLALFTLFAGICVILFSINFKHTFNDETLNTESYWLFQYLQLFSIGLISNAVLSYDEKLQVKINSKIKKRKDLSLIQQAKLKTKQTETLSSIAYGKKIQSGVLSTERELQKHLPNSYIFVKNQSELSGSIFWTKKIDDKVLCAIGSSKLEAIPGAFLSIFGISLLNQFAYLKKPAAILHAVQNQYFKKNTKLKNNKTKNGGIDIGLCSIDLKTKKLEFSGANRSLWISRADEIIEIQGEDSSIVPLENNERSTLLKNHEVDLQEGDIIYLFSRGYVNSENSTEKINYSTQEVRSLFTQLRKVPLLQQKNILKPAFEAWKMERKIESVDVFFLALRA